MLIRADLPDDFARIDALHRAAFPGPLEARLVRLLRKAGRLTVSLVAEVDGEIAGHVAFSPVELAGSSVGLGLAPVAVLPIHQRQGIGRELIRAGLAACSAAGCGFVVVLGDPDYYGRFFGFTRAARWRLVDEYGGGDAFQALELQPDSIPEIGGVVRYSPEFSIFGGS